MVEKMQPWINLTFTDAHPQFALFLILFYILCFVFNSHNAFANEEKFIKSLLSTNEKIKIINYKNYKNGFYFLKYLF